MKSDQPANSKCLFHTGGGEQIASHGYKFETSPEMDFLQENNILFGSAGEA